MILAPSCTSPHVQPVAFAVGSYFAYLLRWRSVPQPENIILMRISFRQWVRYVGGEGGERFPRWAANTREQVHNWPAMVPNGPYVLWTPPWCGTQCAPPRANRCDGLARSIHETMATSKGWTQWRDQSQQWPSTAHRCGQRHQQRWSTVAQRWPAISEVFITLTICGPIYPLVVTSTTCGLVQGLSGPFLAIVWPVFCQFWGFRLQVFLKLAYPFRPWAPV